NSFSKMVTMQEMVDSASLTAAQAGIWLGHQLSDTPAIYNCAEEVTVDGSFSREQFEQALLDVSRAAPSLHVSFIEEAGRPLWRRVPFELRYHYHDLSHEWDPLQAMREQVTLLLQEPLQIERGQLCEHRLFRINE